MQCSASAAGWCEAHANGEFVGGNIRSSQVPAGSDYAQVPVHAARDNYQRYELEDDDLPEIANLRAHHVEALVHLNNDPRHGCFPEACRTGDECLERVGAGADSVPRWCTESCHFILRRTPRERYEWIERLAQGQREHGYRLMYPLLFPFCNTARFPPGTARTDTNYVPRAYDPARDMFDDHTMGWQMRRLMDHHNAE